jgi:acyl-ACP thioesterase
VNRPAVDRQAVSAEPGSLAGTAPATAVVPYRARFDECGADAALRASALLRWAQDVAWIHSERLGYGRQWYVERGLAWVVRGLRLRLLAPISMGSTADVSTSVVGFRRVMARRRTEVHGADGRLLAGVETDWVMTDTTRGVPIRVPAEFPALFAARADGFEPIRVPAETAPASAGLRAFTVRPHELDPMAHANNAIYVDWLEETLVAGEMNEVLSALPRTYRLEYLMAAAPGAELQGSAWASGLGAIRYRLADAADRDMLRAEVIAG